MSYSYTDLLSAIITSRTENEPHAALGHYATLSEKCSMTPLLWIQYAQDSTSVDSSFSLAKEVCEIALEEFPGCVLLWLYYLDVSCATSTLDNNGTEENWTLWTNALKSVKGLQTPPHIMLELYRLAVRCFPKQAEEIFINRAYAILQGNETIVSEMQSFAQDQSIPISSQTYSSVENGRKFVSQNMNILKRYEEEVTVAMSAEKIQLSPSFSFADYVQNDKQENNTKTLFYDWDGILTAFGGMQGRILMGYGMTQTASSFLNYVQHLFHHIKSLRKQSQKEDRAGDEEGQTHTLDLIDLFTSLIVPTYERALSECPTVEILWEKYIKHLTYVLHDDEASTTPAQRANILIQLQNVSSRAVKNCPYSLKLFTMKMQVVLEEVEAGRKLLEPDDLMKIVSEAIDGNFLPDRDSHLGVHMAACRVVKRRIMDVLSRATSSMKYDEPERLEKDSKKKRRRGEDAELKLFTAPLEEDTQQEVQDLIEDLRDMYDTVDAFLRKNYSKWTEGRYFLYKEKATFEAYICTPLLNDCNDDNAIKCFEKLVRVHQPPHPNAFRDYIKYIMGKSFMRSSTEDEDAEEDDGDNHGKIKEMPGMVVAKLRFIRDLYQKALFSTKKTSIEDNTQTNIEFNTAIRLLCEEYSSFESVFGSDKSSTTASKLISKKLAPIMGYSAENKSATLVPPDTGGKIQNSIDSKRKREEDGDEVASGDDEHPTNQPPTVKKAKTNETKDRQDCEMKDEDRVVPAPDSIPGKEMVQKKPPNIWPIKSKPEHLVKVGKMEYPAHPFTVHVSNLASETMDMDLYDMFRSKCGAIVHARIFREKQHGHGHGQIPKSKCAGLIQFEERESIEKALKLSGEVGLHEKLIVLSRSHQSAVGVVPPGMQRLNPKGQGKHTKHNVRRKERRLAATNERGEQETGGDNPEKLKDGKDGDPNESLDDNKEKKKKTSSSVLSFRPRNVDQKKRKKKLGL